MTADAYLCELSDVMLGVNTSGLDRCVQLLRDVKASDREVHLVGNGGSAAVVAHAHNDFVKAAGMRARVYQDISLQSAYTNDDGHTVAFFNPLKLLMRLSDVLIAVSSSGESLNILEAVKAAREHKAIVITLTGFRPANPLRALGDHNVYVQSDNYGYVELAHAAILHYLTDQVATV